MTYSIIKKSQLEGTKRIDAEYYQPEFLHAVELIKSKAYDRLGDIITILADYHANGSYEILRKNVQLSRNPDYALMVRAVDLQTNNYEDNVRYVSKPAYEFLKKTKIIGGEIIIDKIGNAGEVFLMPNLDRPVTLGMNLFMLHLKNEYSPVYVYLFLTSKYGRSIILQRVTGTAPTSIDKESVRGILIPQPSKEVVKQVNSIILDYFQALKDSTNYYQQAEELLLEELEINKLNLENQLSYVINLSDCGQKKRWDADYFQPKYTILLDYLKKNCNAVPLGELVNIKKGIEPGADEYFNPSFAGATDCREGKPFIRVSNMSKNGINDNNQQYLRERLYQELKNDYEPKKGEILLTKDASVGVAYYLKEDIEGIISGGILRLKLKDKNIEPEYLTLCLNSIIGQMQAERDSGGSVIAHWKPEQIKNVLIPVLPKETQLKIGNLVRQSFVARKKAKELLNKAKREVENLIEKVGE